MPCLDYEDYQLLKTQEDVYSEEGKLLGTLHRRRRTLANQSRNLAFLILLLWAAGVSFMPNFTSRRWPIATPPVAIPTLETIPVSAACPNPYFPRPLYGEHPFNFTTPAFLPSLDDAFDMTLSHDSADCNSFRLVISRTDKAHCSAVENVVNSPPSQDEEVLDYVRTKLGPDSFMVKVDGAERLVEETPTKYAGDCVYEFTFRLQNAGNVWIDVLHVFENFDGFREIVAPDDFAPHPKPTLIMKRLLEKPLKLDICSASCTTYSGSQLNNGALSYPSSEERRRAEDDLPLCNPNTTTHGTYIPSSKIDSLYPPFELPTSSFRHTAGHYTFVPAQCKWEHDGLRFSDHAKCHAKKNTVLMVGDSHVRMMLDVVANRLSGFREMARDSVKQEQRFFNIGNLALRFFWAPLGDRGYWCEELKELDAIVLDTGYHHAFQKCTNTTSYLATLEQALRAVPEVAKSCGTSVKQIFMNAPPYYPQQGYQDCRTGQRLKYWNKRAEVLAKKHGWQVIDMHRYTAPHVSDTTLIDSVHYIRTDAVDPIADELIAKLDLCSDDLIEEAKELEPMIQDKNFVVL